MKTRTGNFPIGFRQVNANWNRDIPSLLEWAVENRLEAVDLTTDPESALGAVSDAGLRISARGDPGGEAEQRRRLEAEGVSLVGGRVVAECRWEAGR